MGPFCAGGFRNADRPSGHLPFTTRSLSRPARVRTDACSLSGHLGHSFVVPPVPQKRPNGSGHLRGEGDDSDIGMGAHEQRTQPGAYRSIRLCQSWHGRSRALDQHLTQVATAPLCYAEELRLSSCCRLSGHQTQPGGQIAPFRECRGVADSGHQGGGIQRTDARNACQPSCSLISLGHGREFCVKSGNAAVEFVPPRAHVTEQESHP